MKEALTLKRLQACIKKVDHKSDKKDKYVLKLLEELGELAEAMRKDKRVKEQDTIKGTVEEEMQDVLYYLCCLANVYDIDLEECVYAKEELNAKKWDRNNMFES